MLIFDSTYYQGKPDLGLKTLKLSDRDFYKVIGPNQYDKTRGDETRTRELARACKGQLLCLDIEHWPYDIRKATHSQVETTIDLISEIIDWIRDEEPSIRIGLYGILPIRDYWTPVQGDKDKIRDWSFANARLKKSRVNGRFNAEGLADKVDVVFPSLYTFYDDPAGWEIYAIENIKEAREYGKQVYPFLWPEYHNSNQLLAGKLIPVEHWKKQIDICKEHADGAVIWGGWQREWTQEVSKRFDFLTDKPVWPEPKPEPEPLPDIPPKGPDQRPVQMWMIRNGTYSETDKWGVQSRWENNEDPGPEYVKDLDLFYSQGWRRCMMILPWGTPQNERFDNTVERWYTHCSDAWRESFTKHLTEWTSKHPDFDLGIYMGMRKYDFSIVRGEEEILKYFGPYLECGMKLIGLDATTSLDIREDYFAFQKFMGERGVKTVMEAYPRPPEMPRHPEYEVLKKTASFAMSSFWQTSGLDTVKFDPSVFEIGMGLGQPGDVELRSVDALKRLRDQGFTIYSYMHSNTNPEWNENVLKVYEDINN